VLVEPISPLFDGAHSIRLGQMIEAENASELIRTVLSVEPRDEQRAIAWIADGLKQVSQEAPCYNAVQAARRDWRIGCIGQRHFHPEPAPSVPEVVQ
jgi:hypothetical protein